MRRQAFWLIGGILILIGSFTLAIQTSFAQDIYGSNWQAEYFNSTDLSGTAVLTRVESRIDLNFGQGSPGDGVDIDNFSARFTTTYNFADNNYEFVAQADDGVRVFVDGDTVIDAWQGAVGETRTATRQLSGTRTVRVEYREVNSDAFVRVFWRVTGSGGTTTTGGTTGGATAVPAGPTPTPGPTATPAPTGLPPIPQGAITATVIRASALVVRDAPFLSGNRIGTILRGQTYAVIGRDEGARWFLLQLSDRQGWAWGYYLFIDGNEFSVPVTAPFTLDPPPAGSSGVVVQTTAALRLRQQASVASPQIGRVTWGSLLPVLERTQGGEWYKVTWKGTVGWIYAPFTNVVRGNLNTVPVVPLPNVAVPPAAAPPYDISPGG